MRGISSKRIALKVDVMGRKIYCLQACQCIIRPGNSTGWVSEGVKDDKQTKLSENDVFSERNREKWYNQLKICEEHLPHSLLTST